jgi:hypothetical protein
MAFIKPGWILMDNNLSIVKGRVKLRLHRVGD